MEQEFRNISKLKTLKGSSFNDVFTLDKAANKVEAGNGNDIMIGGAGNDTLDGNFGKDGIADTKKGVAIKIGNIDLSTVEWTGISFFGVGRFKNASKTLMLDTDGVSGLITDSSGNELLLGNAFANGVFNIL